LPIDVIDVDIDTEVADDSFAWSLPLSGQHVAACYFMWPIAFQDGHEFPAYVQREKLIELMVQMEAGHQQNQPPRSKTSCIFSSMNA